VTDGKGSTGTPGSRAVVTASNIPDPQQLFNELDAELALLALTHRSFAYEHGGLPTNERLEFLGDSVLGIVVTDALYHDHPDLPEGRLAKLRASIVNMHALAGVGRAMGLGHMLRLGRGEELTGGRDKASIVADAVEAVLGAVYLEHGIEVARTVVHTLFADLMADAPRLGAGLDWKTSLQELSAARGLGVPEYRVTEEGPDHAKSFAAVVILAGAVHGNGAGRTKKEAEQQAASAAFTAIESAGADETSIAADDELTPTIDDTVTDRSVAQEFGGGLRDGTASSGV
jgi:ribonuclease-3